MGERVYARELYEYVAFESVFGPITMHERIDEGLGVSRRKRQSPEEMTAYMRGLQKRT